MSVFHENMLIGASGQGAAGPTAGRSVRFNSADSAYLSRTPASAGNRKTWTWSIWAKLSGPYDATDDYLFYAYGSGTSQLSYLDFRWQSSTGNFYIGGYSTAWRVTTAVFRDPSAWYHIVLTWDTTQSTAADRIKLYVNGVQQTAFSSSSNPNLNDETSVSNTVQHRIGNTSNFYLALVHFIDGQALTPSSFGETSATTGQWIAKTYSGTYGTNGFFLDFADNSTAAALGYDAAGSNDWTVNNLSVTAGSGNDSLRDHPTSAGTSTGLGGEVSGNYCTLNPLQNSTAHVLSDGNLRITGAAGYATTPGTIGMASGKWYWEQTLTNASASDINLGIGNRDTPLSSYIGDSARSYGFSSNNRKWNNGSTSTYTTSWIAGDIIGLAFNADAGSLTLYKNGVSLGVAFSSIPADTYFPMAAAYGTGSISNLNFGQRPFAYTAPSGFSPLVDTLLPTPTIAKPNTVMDVALYTGNGSSQSVTGLGFSPDLAWIKRRGVNSDHNLFDTVRGATKVIKSNNTDAEVTASTSLTAFNSDGFTVGSNSDVNGNTHAIVAWTWDAGSSNATNTSGTITSTVRANISAGFSVVTYTGAGSNGTVGHGLGVAPEMVIVKCRSNANDWAVYHKYNTSAPETDYLLLNSTAATADDNTYWNDTAPTSSLFSIGTNTDVNTSAYTYVAYCWAPVAGYSAFGSYTGTGDTNGPFVHTGFRVRWLMVKITNAAGYNWIVMDAQRSTYNAASHVLSPNVSNAEYTDAAFDFLSNGFKPVKSSAETNTNGGTFVWAAFAEAPFPYARAR